MDNDISVLDLKDLTIPERVVEVPGTRQAFRVRGLDMYLLMGAFKDHLDVLDALFNGQGEDIVQEVVTGLPDLSAHLISMAATTDGTGIDIAKKLPVQVQAMALKEIFDLTFPDEELLGKFWAWLESRTENLAAAYRKHLLGQTS